MERPLKALELATKAHGTQTRRDSGLPYIIHPIRVAHKVNKYLDFVQLQNSIQTLTCAAFLHDTLEDTNLTHEDIRKNCGEATALLVLELTSFIPKGMDKGEYLRFKIHSDMSDDAIYIKLCDRLDNIEDYLLSPNVERAKAYSRQTRFILNELEKFSPLVEDILKVCDQIDRK